MALKIALTGGIASGKSIVAGLFATLQVPVIDADQVARDMVMPGSEGLKAITDYFGQEYLAADGKLDRKKLREHVFNNEQERLRLNAILHPRIRSAMQKQAAAIDAPYIVFMIPLLLETSQQHEYDRVLVVSASEQQRLARVQQRDKVTESDAQAILRAQASEQSRLALADDVIINNGTVAELQPQVAKLHNLYLTMAGSN